MSQSYNKIAYIGMKTVRLVLLWTTAGALALLSASCTATRGQNSNVSLQMPGTGATSQAQSDNDRDSYQPPRDPQFNTALDQ
jgi:hypothetical protein